MLNQLNQLNQCNKKGDKKWNPFNVKKQQQHLLG